MTTITTSSVTFPTYPARPVSGGPFPAAREKAGQWAYEPKYNGWRALVHIASGTMFNRHGQLLTISAEFKVALDCLRSTLDAEAFKWADVEALERRHNIGRGCLIVLDVIPEPAYRATPYIERRQWLEAVLPQLEYYLPPWADRCGGFVSGPNKFPLLSMPPTVAPAIAWCELTQANKILGCPFYEGLVAKRIDSAYPFQIRNPEEAYPFCLKCCATKSSPNSAMIGLSSSIFL